MNCISDLFSSDTSGVGCLENIKVFFGRDSIDIPIETITLFEGHSNYTYVCTVDGSRYLICKTLKSLLKRVGPNFARVHKSFIINLSYVVARTIDGSMIKMRCGSKAVVSRRKIKRVIEIIGPSVEQIED